MPYRSLPADLSSNDHVIYLTGAQFAGYSIIRSRSKDIQYRTECPYSHPSFSQRPSSVWTDILLRSVQRMHGLSTPSKGHSVRHTFLSVANVSSLAQGSRRRSLTSMSMVRLEELSTNSSVHSTIRTTVGHVFRRWNSLFVGSPKSDRRCRWLAYFLREAPRTSSSKTMVHLA